MDYEFRVVVEKVSVSKQVIKRDTLKIYDIEKPESILDLAAPWRTDFSTF